MSSLPFLAFILAFPFLADRAVLEGSDTRAGAPAQEIALRSRYIRAALENASRLVAEQVPGIDAILVGHAHKDLIDSATNTTTGQDVLLVEPLYWGMRVTRMSLDLQKIRGQWQVVHSEAMLYNAKDAPEDPTVSGAVAGAHAKVLTYVNGVIGTSKQQMSAATSRYEDTAAMDFINLSLMMSTW